MYLHKRARKITTKYAHTQVNMSFFCLEWSKYRVQAVLDTKKKLALYSKANFQNRYFLFPKAVTLCLYKRGYSFSLVAIDIVYCKGFVMWSI